MRRFFGALVLFVTIVNTDYIRKKGGRTTITTPLVVDGLSLRSTLRRRRLPWRRATKQPHQKEHPDLQREAIQHELEKEMRSISFYSFLHNAALPLADLVDGSFMSVLPASSLGAIGVVRSSQNSVSKLYNSPLSKTTISSVASASGKRQARQDEATANATSTNTASASVVVSNDDEKEARTMESLPAVVSSALLLAVMLGTIQALVFCIGAKSILHASGIDYGTDMYAPAMSFMKARALSAPTATLWLVATNVFRGLGDATTPLMCAILMNLVNWLGDYLLIRKFHVGIAATAIGTTVAQFVALLPLLYRLQRRHVRFWMKTSLASFRQYLQRYGAAGIYLIGRSMARIAAVSYCARRSAQFGSVTASAYSVLYQLGLWVTIVLDGVSIATQSSLSRYLPNERPPQQKNAAPGSNVKTTSGSKTGGQYNWIPSWIVRYSLKSGLALAGVMVVLLHKSQGSLVAVFSKDTQVQRIAAEAFPIFLVAQAAKGFAFPVNGIIMGGMDWKIAMWSMCFANAACWSTLKLLSLSVASKIISVQGLWIAWAAYYLVQGLVGTMRLASHTGPWEFLAPTTRKQQQEKQSSQADSVGASVSKPPPS